MKPEEMAKLADNNLKLQLQLLADSNSAYSMATYCVSSEVRNIYNILTNKEVRNRQATDSSPDYATITLTSEEYDKTMRILMRIANSELSYINNSSMKTAHETIGNNQKLLAVLTK